MAYTWHSSFVENNLTIPWCCDRKNCHITYGFWASALNNHPECLDYYLSQRSQLSWDEYKYMILYNRQNMFVKVENESLYQNTFFGYSTSVLSQALGENNTPSSEEFVKFYLKRAFTKYPEYYENILDTLVVSKCPRTILMFCLKELEIPVYDMMLSHCRIGGLKIPEVKKYENKILNELLFLYARMQNFNDKELCEVAKYAAENGAVKFLNYIVLDSAIEKQGQAYIDHLKNISTEDVVMQTCSFFSSLSDASSSSSNAYHYSSDESE